MLTYNMDVEPASVWKRTTLTPTARAQPFYCTEAGLFYGRKHFSTARTDKESWLLFYTIQGSGLIEQGDAAVTLNPGQALLLDCRQPQSYCTSPGKRCWHHYWVHLDGAGVQAMTPLLVTGRRLTVAQPDRARMTALCELLLAQMDLGTLDSIVQTGVALHQMLALCARGALAEGEGDTNRQIVMAAAEWLRTHYAEDLSIARMQDNAHMSRSYFWRLFRRYTGTTPYNYLINCRITRAKELLVVTDRSVSQIAADVGFSNVSNFSTRFAGVTGRSPLQYRRAARGLAADE